MYMIIKTHLRITCGERSEKVILGLQNNLKTIIKTYFYNLKIIVEGYFKWEKITKNNYEGTLYTLFWGYLNIVTTQC